MKKTVLVAFMILIPALVMAADKPSEPFTYSIVGRVCTAGACEIFSSGETVRAILKEDSKKPGDFTGEIKSSYSIKTFKFESKVQISQFAYGSNYQTNLFLSTNEAGSIEDHGSAEIIVDAMKELNSVAQYSTPFIYGDSKIEIAIVIGPTTEAVSAKAKTLYR